MNYYFLLEENDTEERILTLNEPSDLSSEDIALETWKITDQLLNNYIYRWSEKGIKVSFKILNFFLETLEERNIFNCEIKDLKFSFIN